MKHLLSIAIVISIFSYGCKDAYPNEKIYYQVLEINGKEGMVDSITLHKDTIRIYRNNRIDDLVYPYSQPDSNRYFLVSYTFKDNEGGGGQGNAWFGCDGFPRKIQIDSIVFKSLPMKRKCYQNIIINSIYEFNDRDEYLLFGEGSISDKDIKRKKVCE